MLTIRSADHSIIPVICIWLGVFGANYTFQKDIERNSALKARLTELNYQYLDGDHTDANIDANRYRLLKGNGDYPFFVITDTHGDVYRITAGYSSAEEFLEIFNPEALSSCEVIIKRDMITSQELRKLSRRQSGMPFLARLTYTTPLRIGVEGGVVLSNLGESETFVDYKIGYYGSVYVKRYLPHNMAIQGGLSFYSLGGKHTALNENLRLNYLSLPIDFECLVLRPRIIPGFGRSYINLGVGVYGSYLLSDKMPTTIQQPISDWDAGVRLRLVLQQGSFRLIAGYIRGFLDLFSGPNKAYTNAFQFGVTLSLGD